jgi:hypothetical protein
MVPETAFIMPDCPTDVPGLEFVGWLITTDLSDNTYVSPYTTTGETLLEAGAPYTVSGNVSFVARYQQLNISLLDDDSNADESNYEKLFKYHDMTAYSVTLTGRTISKDGNWNTLCLPFGVTAAQMAVTTHPLYGATIKALDTSSSSLDGGVLTLSFKDASSIEAGTPYIVKWEGSCGTVVDPVFPGVTITSDSPDPITSSDKTVTFEGQYSPFTIGDTSIGTFDGNLNEIILLGSGSKLGYSKTQRSLRAFRAHFCVPAAVDGNAGARSFVLNFGNDGTTTGIFETENSESEGRNSELVYDLQGCRVNHSQFPMVKSQLKKGMYIYKGKVFVIP